MASKHGRLGTRAFHARWLGGCNAATHLTETDDMDKEHLKGTAKKVEGGAKEAAGKVSGDRSLEAEGKLDKAEGEVRKTVGDVKDAVRDRKKD